MPTEPQPADPDPEEDTEADTEPEDDLDAEPGTEPPTRPGPTEPAPPVGPTAVDTGGDLERLVAALPDADGGLGDVTGGVSRPSQALDATRRSGEALTRMAEQAARSLTELGPIAVRPEFAITSLVLALIGGFVTLQRVSPQRGLPMIHTGSGYGTDRGGERARHRL